MTTSGERNEFLRTLLGVNRLSECEAANILNSNMRIGIALSAVFIVLESIMLINNCAFARNPVVAEHADLDWALLHRLGYVLQLVSALILMGGCLAHTFRKPLKPKAANTIIAQYLLISLALSACAAYGDLLRDNGIYVYLTQLISITCVFVIRPAISLPPALLCLELLLDTADQHGALTHGLMVNAHVFFVLIIIISCVHYTFAVRMTRSQEILRRNAMTDELTGIGNVRAFRTDILGCIRGHVAVAAIDMDNFKLYNDRYGHLTGDYVLKYLALALQETLGSKARYYRMGGDEFLVISTNLTCSEMAHKMQQVRKTLNRSLAATELFAGFSPVAFSYGLASGTAESEDDLTELVRSADQRMYKMKQDGRLAAD